MSKSDLLTAGLVTLAAAAMALVATAAQAEAPRPGASCGPRATIVQRLSSHFGETRRGIGLGTRNRVLEVFASDATGTWTVTVTLPDGRTCLIASGQDWEDRMDDLSHLQDADA